MKVNRETIDAALVAKGYAPTEEGFLQFADDNFEPSDSIGSVITALDPQWSPPAGSSPVTIEQVEFSALFDNDLDVDAGDYVAAHTDAAG